MRKLLLHLVPRNGFMIFLVTFSVTGTIFSFIDGIVPEKKKDCGVVREKIIVPGGHKQGGDLYLGVDFENSGFKAMKVSPETYMEYQPGNEICFWLPPVLTLSVFLISFEKFFSCVFIFFYLLYNVISHHAD
jgi:hypothetical protein